MGIVMPAPRTEPHLRAIGARLQELRRSLGLTQDEMGKRLGMSAAGYQNYEVGRANLTLVDVPRLAVAFGITVGELLVKVGLDKPGAIPGVRRVGAVAMVPLVEGVKLSAGVGWSDPIDYVPVPKELLAEYPYLLAVPVTGDCMEPEINDGDIVFVDTANLSPRPDQLVAVLTEEGTMLVKRYGIDHDGPLLSDNHGRVLRPNGATVQGVIVVSQRRHL